MNTGDITQAGQIIASDVKGDVDTLKSYFEGTQMLDLDGSGPTEVASKIDEVTQDWANVTDVVSTITDAAEVIENIPV